MPLNLTCHLSLVPEQRVNDTSTPLTLQLLFPILLFSSFFPSFVWLFFLVAAVSPKEKQKGGGKLELRSSSPGKRFDNLF